MMPALNITQLLARTSLASWHDPLDTPVMRVDVAAILAAIARADKPLTIKQLHSRGCCISHERCGTVVRLMHDCGRLTQATDARPYTYTTPQS
jgi:hypothetical protein